ncbi:MAG: MotA/TolQ/ExbB proton channel family protein [Granulosicoccus sp.]
MIRVGAAAAAAGIRRDKKAVPVQSSKASFFYPQLWFLLISLMAFAAYVAWDLNYFQGISRLDRSYMASVILALTLAASIHCGWHIVQFARRIAYAQKWLNSKILSNAAATPFLKHFLDDLSMNSAAETSADDAVVESHAVSIRAPVELGWFFVDLAVRLGLLGTIIGFILIFSSLTGVDLTGGQDLKNLLVAMSGGMGTALLTTLTGLVCASMLSFQYLILGRESEHLVGLLLRIRNRLRND